MEFRMVGRKDEFELFGLCDLHGYLVVKNSPQEFSEILQHDGFRKAVRALKPTKIAFEQTTKRKWFIRLLVASETMN
jgi:hypothetical protein